MANRIPITFEHEGKKYSGEFKAVSGAGKELGSNWHLYINKFYYGQLLNLDRGWAFYSNNGLFENLSDFFGDYLIAWHESNA